MAHPSDQFFRTFHALRIEGSAKSDTVAAVADLPLVAVAEHLSALELREWAMFREARELWQLTPVGRDEHRISRAEDAGGLHLAAELAQLYAHFLELNERFKALCGDWQLREGQPNDHGNQDYDRQVVERLVALDLDIAPIAVRFGEVLVRLAPYGPRLARTCQRVVEGETNMFTGVMCGSYHDVWMELHQDLIVTQGIDRFVEGSF